MATTKSTANKSKLANATAPVEKPVEATENKIDIVEEKETLNESPIVSYKAKKGEDLLKALLETDEGASHFGEVAIGTNYGIKKFTRNMLFDEKIGGTVHMAIGDSMPEAGGKNKSSLHWDMLCDMRNGGRIYADGELFYENGEFKKEILEK